MEGLKTPHFASDASKGQSLKPKRSSLIRQWALVTDSAGGLLSRMGLWSSEGGNLNIIQLARAIGNRASGRNPGRRTGLHKQYHRILILGHGGVLLLHVSSIWVDLNATHRTTPSDFPAWKAIVMQPRECRGLVWQLPVRSPYTPSPRWALE